MFAFWYRLLGCFLPSFLVLLCCYLFSCTAPREADSNQSPERMLGFCLHTRPLYPPIYLLWPSHGSPSPSTRLVARIKTKPHLNLKRSEIVSNQIKAGRLWKVGAECVSRNSQMTGRVTEMRSWLRNLWVNSSPSKLFQAEEAILRKIPVSTNHHNNHNHNHNNHE